MIEQRMAIMRLWKGAERQRSLSGRLLGNLLQNDGLTTAENSHFMCRGIHSTLDQMMHVAYLPISAKILNPPLFAFNYVFCLIYFVCLPLLFWPRCVYASCFARSGCPCDKIMHLYTILKFAFEWNYICFLFFMLC